MSVLAADLRSDLRIMGLVGSAHAASHFFHLTLPPLFPLLKSEFGVSYSALALLTTLFYGVSGIAQTIAGFLVDRFGARRVLLSGLSLLCCSVIGYGLVSEFWMLLLFSVYAGLGNSVIHQADLSILTSKITPQRLGKAYGVHALSGNIGWAAAPVFVATIAHFSDWRIAVISAGLLGLLVTGFFVVYGKDLRDSENSLISNSTETTQRRGGLYTNIRLLFSPTILSCFFFFALLAAALIGVQSFGVSAIRDLYNIDLQNATVGLTAFLLFSALGILVGGILADKTNRHDIIAIVGVILAGLILLLIGSQNVPVSTIITFFALSGFFSGVTAPSRDMLVRKATPHGATGRIFGFVYSGLDLGSSLMPLLLGWLMDIGRVHYVFYACATMLFAPTVTIVNVKKKSLSRRQ